MLLHTFTNILVKKFLGNYLVSPIFICFPYYKATCSPTQVTELLLKAGANVNAMDLWQFTPLHEAAAKARTEVGREEEKTNLKKL